MKANLITLLAVLILSFNASAQARFSKRKYTKGHFTERITRLKHKGPEDSKRISKPAMPETVINEEIERNQQISTAAIGAATVPSPDPVYTVAAVNIEVISETTGKVKKNEDLVVNMPPSKRALLRAKTPGRQASVKVAATLKPTTLNKHKGQIAASPKKAPEKKKKTFTESPFWKIVCYTFLLFPVLGYCFAVFGIVLVVGILLYIFAAMMLVLLFCLFFILLIMLWMNPNLIDEWFDSTKDAISAIIRFFFGWTTFVFPWTKHFANLLDAIFGVTFPSVE